MLSNRVALVMTTALAPSIWGTTYFVTTQMLPPDRPLLAAVIRALPAGLLLIAITRRLPHGVWWWRALVLGFCNIGVFLALLFVAAYRLPGGIAATVGAITATRPPAGRENELVAATTALLAGLAGSSVRLLAVGGAGSLTVPGSGGRAAIDDLSYVPPPAQPIARACTDQYETYRADTQVSWTYASPAASLYPGDRTGRYRQGLDDLVVDSDGRSAISMEDFAVALVDEAERPRHHRRRFTVGY